MWLYSSTPAFFFNMEMKFSLSWGDIPSAEQSPTPHSAPLMQYLSEVDCRFLMLNRVIKA